MVWFLIWHWFRVLLFVTSGESCAGSAKRMQRLHHHPIIIIHLSSSNGIANLFILIFSEQFYSLTQPNQPNQSRWQFFPFVGWSLGKWGKNTKPWTWKGEGSSVNAVPRLTLFLFFPSLHRVALPNCGSGCDSLSPSLEKKLKTKRVESNSNRTFLGKSDPDLS